MSANLSRTLPGAPRKGLAMRPDMSEAARKSFADVADLSEIGRIIERAIELSSKEKKVLAGAMGYADPSALSRWIAGLEAASFARLWSVRWLRPSLVAALAERAGLGVETKTVITITRREGVA